jgi:hypothetical protein
MFNKITTLLIIVFVFGIFSDVHPGSIEDAAKHIVENRGEKAVSAECRFKNDFTQICIVITEAKNEIIVLCQTDDTHSSCMVIDY